MITGNYIDLALAVEGSDMSVASLISRLASTCAYNPVKSTFSEYLPKEAQLADHGLNYHLLAQYGEDLVIYYVDKATGVPWIHVGAFKDVCTLLGFRYDEDKARQYIDKALTAAYIRGSSRTSGRSLRLYDRTGVLRALHKARSDIENDLNTVDQLEYPVRRAGMLMHFQCEIARIELLISVINVEVRTLRLEEHARTEAGISATCE